MEALLLADPSPCLRRLVLRDLLHVPQDDPEYRELDALRSDDPLVAGLLTLQGGDGSWPIGDGAWRSRRRPLMVASLALYRLGYLGFTPQHPSIAKGAEYLMSKQAPDGSWLFSDNAEDDEEGMDWSPIDTAMPLRALLATGHTEGEAIEKAFGFLLDARLDDGAWPTGYAKGNMLKVAGYRRMAHSKWGCRSATTAAAQCLALHPQERTSDAAQRALDLLLGRETRDAHALGFDLARLLGMEAPMGRISFYARYDLGLILDLCARIEADRDDPRIDDMVRFLLSLREPHGLWTYRAKPQCSRWLTFDLLRSLDRLRTETDWHSREPRTPFSPYPHRKSRY